jgi:hypothetical protein
MARMVEGLLLHQQQQPIRQRTASIASRSVIGITNGNRSNEVRKFSFLTSKYENSSKELETEVKKAKN